MGNCVVRTSEQRKNLCRFVSRHIRAKLAPNVNVSRLAIRKLRNVKTVTVRKYRVGIAKLSYLGPSWKAPVTLANVGETFHSGCDTSQCTFEALIVHALIEVRRPANIDGGIA